MDPIAAALAPLHRVAVPATYAFAIVVIFGEFFVLRALQKRVSVRGGVTSLASGGLSFGLLFLADRALFGGLYAWSHAHRFATLGTSWPVWLGAFVVYDLMFYVAHRAGHEVRALWCFHAVHHTADEMRLSSAVRGSALDFIYLPWFFVWIPLLGVHPLMLLTVEALSRMWGIATHVSPHLVGRLGPLHGLLVTPSVHRVHHGRDVDYLDRNYGEVLLLWDRLFGTWQRETHAPTYGVTTPIDANGLVAIQVGFWQGLARDLARAPDWRSRARYLLDAPGYAHDGPDHRVRVIQAQSASGSSSP